jgi:hypothetical protein
MIGPGHMYMSATLNDRCHIHDIIVVVEYTNPKNILKNERADPLNSIPSSRNDNDNDLPLISHIVNKKSLMP